MKISVVIPAYNAARTLPGVLERIPAETLRNTMKIWIVNDGSTDHTESLARSLAKDYEPVHVLSLGHNHGYGGAMKKGLDAAKDDCSDLVVGLHADGQYAPESLPELLNAMKENSLDILQGTRLATPKAALSGGMPLYKYIAGRALVLLENQVFGLGLTDYHSGYMLYGKKAIDCIDYHALSNGFDFDLEMIASARTRGLSIGEHPIPTRYADEVSHLKPVRYGLQVLRVLIDYKRGRYDAQTFAD